MNEELQKQLAALLQSLMAVAGDATSFAKAQAFPLVQEKIMYGRISSLVWLVLCLGVVAIAGRYAFRNYATAIKKGDRYDIFIERQGGALAVLCSAASVASMVAAFLNLDSAMLAWFAPRLYIVEWLKGMVTK